MIKLATDQTAEYTHCPEALALRKLVDEELVDIVLTAQIASMIRQGFRKVVYAPVDYDNYE